MTVLVTTPALVSGVLEATLPNETGTFDALIASVSQEFERQLDRWLLQTARTVQLDARADQREWSLKGCPVASIASIKFSSTRDFASATAIDSSRYYIGSEEDDHLLEIDSPDATGRGVLQIVYTGGMAVDTDAFVAAYPALAMQAAMEVANLWMRKGTQSVLSVSSGADKQQLTGLRFSQITRDAINNAKRWTH